MNQKKSTKLLRILYPIWAIVGMFSILYVPSKLITENATDTAKNILENQLLFRLSIAGSLLTQLLFIAAALLLFELFMYLFGFCLDLIFGFIRGLNSYQDVTNFYFMYAVFVHKLFDFQDIEALFRSNEITDIAGLQLEGPRSVQRMGAKGVIWRWWSDPLLHPQHKPESICL